MSNVKTDISTLKETEFAVNKALQPFFGKDMHKNIELFNAVLEVLKPLEAKIRLHEHNYKQVQNIATEKREAVIYTVPKQPLYNQAALDSAIKRSNERA